MFNNSIFPSPVENLPKADIPIEGLKAYLSQGSDHQIIFMQFDKDVEIPPHSHEAQWGIVLEGKIDVTFNGVTTSYKKGDRYFLEKGTVHSVKIYAGYADMTFFDQKERYSVKS